MEAAHGVVVGFDVGRYSHHMTAIDADELSGADFKVTWKTVTSSRLDAAALRKAEPELCERYTKTTTTRRFNVA